MKLSSPALASLIVLLVLIGFAYAYLSQSGDATPLSGGYATSTESYECHADGMICPDGSVVGRTGPRCEFSACPGQIPVGGPLLLPR